MNKSLIILSLVILLFSCNDSSYYTSIKVNNETELKNAIESAQAGNEIILANGIWENIQIKFTGKGTGENPIILRAETEGQVSLEGQSSIQIAGEYLTVSGLYFKNGYSPLDAVIEFRINEDSIANHCIVTNCVIDGVTKPSRATQDHWVVFWGRHNQLDHCYIAGKFNQGPTVKVFLTGNQHIKNYHQIVNNYFGPRPRKGGPKAETIQIGSSFTSMTPSHVIIANNFFEKCNGEVEIISNKSNNCEIRNNIFYESEGSLVLRHGNYCIVDGNYFIGNDKSTFFGGIRVINTGHWITNNYFYKIKGEEFRSPLAIMNGIDKSPLNRYNQVTDVVVAHNTWIDCISPWQFSVGANMSKKDILPAQEIRAARPLRILVANNVIYNHDADKEPIKAYDKVDGVTFKNNVIDNKNVDFQNYGGIDQKELKMEMVSEGLFIPVEEQTDIYNDVYPGFGFEDISKDILEANRVENNMIGAIIIPVEKDQTIINRKAYGPTWFSNETPIYEPKIIEATSAEGEIANKLSQANDGDIIELSGEYKIKESLVINRKITIRSKDKENRAQIIFLGENNKPAFEMNPKGNLILEDIILKGIKEAIAFAPLEKDMSNIYNLSVINSEISDFEYVLKAYKTTMADTISFTNSILKNCMNGIELAAETDDKGDYNAEVLIVKDCTFENVQANVINFYRGGYDESTIGGCLTISNSKFIRCGSKESSKILLQTRGIVNVDISGNTFQDNSVKFIAILWGEKNNHHSNNTLTHSGEILVEKYLKQKLVY